MQSAAFCLGAITKAASESQRTATAKIAAIKGQLSGLKRTELKDRDSRIFPGVYAPVIRHLERLPLGVSYPAQIGHLEGLLQRAPFNQIKAKLVVDYTGVGRPVFDMFAESQTCAARKVWSSQRAGRLTRSPRAGRCRSGEWPR